MPAKIKYGDNIIASVFPGQTATVNIKGSLPQSNIEVDLSQFSGGSASPVLQEKTITANGEYTPDEGYDGLSKVTVAVEVIDRYDEGVEAGKKAHYDAFWDAYQQNGAREDYTYAFANRWWARTNFLPKYDLVGLFNVTFHGLNRDDPNWETFDMVEHLKNLGVTLDTSKSTIMLSTFMWASIGRLGVIDCTGMTGQCNLTTTFAHGKIKTIDKLIVKESNIYPDTFLNQAELVNITFEGTIGSAISFAQSSKLFSASVQSVIDHLKDLTGATAQTLTLHADVGGNMTAEQKAAITAKNWTLVY